MPIPLYFSPQLERTPANAKKYDAYADTHFPQPADAWKHASLLNRFDYTPIAFAGGKRIGSGFAFSQVLAFDLDHIYPEGDITSRPPKEVADLAKKALSLPPSVSFMAVPSHRLNGLHIFLPLDRPIRDPACYKRLFSYLVSTHPLLDQQVKDLGRFFYATAVDPAVFARYSVFQKGEPCSVDIVMWQAGQAERKRREAAKRRRKHSEEGGRQEREFDWTRWEFGEGSRNSSLYKSACSLLAGHWYRSEEEAEGAWRAKAEETGLAEREIDGIWKSARRFCS